MSGERLSITIGQHVEWCVSIDLDALKEYGDPDEISQWYPGEIRRWLADTANETDGTGWLIMERIKASTGFLAEEAFVFIEPTEPDPLYGTHEVEL